MSLLRAPAAEHERDFHVPSIHLKQANSAPSGSHCQVVIGVLLEFHFELWPIAVAEAGGCAGRGKIVCRGSTERVA